MTEKIKRKVISISDDLKEIINGTNKHFTFIVHKNKILSLGWNDYYLTHPKLKENGYGHCGMHSELSAIIKYRGDTEFLRKCTLINTRINSFREIGMSKPCIVCERLIRSLGFKKVYFTNRQGNWEQLI